jgi:hypothetical protein
MDTVDSPAGLVIAGAEAGDPAAAGLAREVRRVHLRYAREVVAAHGLCPFVADPEAAFGRFTVVLDHEPSLSVALAEIAAARGGVAHLVYPLVLSEAAPFERFGNRLHEQARAALGVELVHATFHPRMEGSRDSAARLVGLLRRAPDPFVQLVPHGLHEGGTVYADPGSLDPTKLPAPRPDHALEIFERLRSESIDDIERALREIRADRERSYAPYLAALTRG